MSDDKTPGKQPSHIAYHVRQAHEGQSHFNRVGAAWPHSDGQGFNVVLDSMPVDGRVTLRTTQTEPEPTQPQAAQAQSDRGHSR